MPKAADIVSQSALDLRGQQQQQLDKAPPAGQQHQKQHQPSQPKQLLGRHHTNVLHPHYSTTAELARAYETAHTAASNDHVSKIQANKLRGVMLKVIEKFSNSLQTQDNIDEVVPLAACKDKVVIRQLIEVMLTQMRDQMLCEPTLIVGLTQVLMVAPKGVFTAGDMPVVLELVVKTLENLQEDSNVTAYFNAIALLLDTMYDSRMEISTEMRDRIRRQIVAKFESNTNPEIFFQAQYTSEVLQRVPIPEDDSMGRLRKVLLVVEIVGSIALIIASHGTDLSAVITMVQNCTQLFSASVISDLAVQAVNTLTQDPFQGALEYVSQVWSSVQDVAASAMETYNNITAGAQALQANLDQLQGVLRDKKRKGWYTAARTVSDTVRLFANLDRSTDWKIKFADLTASVLAEAKKSKGVEFTMAVTRSMMLAYNATDLKSQARPAIVKFLYVLVSAIESKSIKDPQLLALQYLLQSLAQIAQGTSLKDAEDAKSFLLDFERRVSGAVRARSDSSSTPPSSSTSVSSKFFFWRKEKKKFDGALTEALTRVLAPVFPDMEASGYGVELLQPDRVGANGSAAPDSPTVAAGLSVQHMDIASALLTQARKEFPVQYRVDTVLFEEFWGSRARILREFETFVPPKGDVRQESATVLALANSVSSNPQQQLQRPQPQPQIELLVPHGDSQQCSISSGLPVHEAAMQFLASPAASVLLIQGVAGAGKSSFLKFLHKTMWEDYTYDRRIPLMVPLASLDNPASNAIQQVLKSYGFSADEITTMRQCERFVFLLDGYDEIKTETNLYMTNKLRDWNAKVIITCRSEYLANRNYQKLFQSDDMAFMNGSVKAGREDTPAASGFTLNGGLVEVTMRPFDEDDIDNYLRKIADKEGKSTGWKFDTYRKALSTTPGLEALVKTPFLLSMVVRILPTLAAAHARNADAHWQAQNTSVNGASLSERRAWASVSATTAATPVTLNLAETTETAQITRTEVYEEFVRCWFRAEESKIRTGPERALIPERFDFEASFRAFSSDFAFSLFLADKTSVDMRSHNYEAQVLAEQKSAWDRFFKGKNDDLKVYFASQGTPWRTVGARRSFIHKSLLEFFVSVILFDELLYLSKNPHAMSPDMLWNRKLLHTEPSVLQFLVDRLNSDPMMLDLVLAILTETKRQPKLCTAGANAMTLLNYARVLFKDIIRVDFDFRGVAAEGANLIDALLADVDLSGANLSKSLISGAMLYNVKLDGCNLTGLDFGLQLWQMSVEVTSVVFHPIHNNLLLIPDSAENGIRFVDTITGDFTGNVLKGYSDTRVAALAIDPTGVYVAASAASLTQTTANTASPVLLWDLKTCMLFGKPMQGHSAFVSDLAFNFDGRRLATCGHDGFVIIWSVYTQEVLLRLECCNKALPSDNTKLWNVAFHPVKHDVLFVVGESGACWVWNIASTTGTLLLVKTINPDDPIHALSVSPDGNLLAVTGKYSSIELLNSETLECVGSLKNGHESKVRAVCFSHSGQLLASSGVDGSARLWSVATRETFGPPLRGEKRPVWGLAFSPDDKFVACGSKSKTCRLWTVHALSPPVVGHDRRINGLDFSADGKRLISASNDNQCIVWSLSAAQSHTIGGVLTSGSNNSNALSVHILDQTDRHYVPTRLCAFTSIPRVSGSQQHALYGTKQWLRLISVGTKTTKLCEIDQGRPMTHAAYSPTTTIAVIALKDDTTVTTAKHGSQPTLGECCIWDFGDKSPSNYSRGRAFHTASVNYVAFTPDGTHFVTACQDGQIHFWDITVCERVNTLSAPPSWYPSQPEPLSRTAAAPATVAATTLAFDPRGNLLAAVYDSANGAEIRFWKAVSSSTTSSASSTVEFDLYGQPILSRTYVDEETKIQGAVHSMHFSDTNELLATGQTDNGDFLINLWNPATQSLVCRVEWACEPCVVRFSPTCLMSTAGTATEPEGRLRGGSVDVTKPLLLAVGDEQGSIILWEFVTAGASASAPLQQPQLQLRAIPSHAGMELNCAKVTAKGARLDQDMIPLFEDMGVELAPSTSSVAVSLSQHEPRNTGSAEPAQPAAAAQQSQALEAATLTTALRQISSVLEEMNGKLDGLTERVDTFEQSLQLFAQKMKSDA